MSTETEGTFRIDDVELYIKTFTPTGPIKAKLIFIHGFSDHVHRYYDFFPTIAARGIQVFTYDQRGWGRSVHKPTDRGNTGPTTRVVADMVAFITDKLPPASSEASDANSAEVPVFLMGHSMGGGQVATLASDPANDAILSRLRGILLESPFMAFTAGAEPSAVKVSLGRLASRFLPWYQLYNPLNVEHVSRDPEVVESVRADELCHDMGTLEGLAGLLDRTGVLSGGTTKVRPAVGSLFVMHGSADMITSPEAARQWLERQEVEDGRYKSYEGAYHQLHADLCKDEFYKDVGDWILERSGPEDAQREAASAGAKL